MEENNALELRALDPQTDIELLRDAYSWRNKNASKFRPDKASFETFAASDPNQIVMGLFNGQLCAVYVIYQIAPGHFDTHYTSRRKTPKEYVLAGAQRCLKWLLDNGAIEVAAYVSEHNKPLRAFVETIGFEPQGTIEFENTPTKFIKLAAYQPSKT